MAPQEAQKKDPRLVEILPWPCPLTESWSTKGMLVRSYRLALALGRSQAKNLSKNQSMESRHCPLTDQCSISAFADGGVELAATSVLIKGVDGNFTQLPNLKVYLAIFG